MERLEQIPRMMFLKADRAQQTRLLDHIWAAKSGESICIAEYAFTLKNFSDALVARKQADVEVYVLVDFTWSKSCQHALKVIGDLQAAGANLSLAAFTNNADYVTEV
ncbi:hypothetical protein PHYBOEH_001907 [Phytophthora boehmeriae]|uniref:Uncharacterized protein n=1 Tax=Phytophthora boehmeriae TaxID=109152 RepID=A0A8T1WY84_9STRA|nr:hypothetical protein PHYBOEH_001907 [Phytophthora boehmeriae]